MPRSRLVLYLRVTCPSSVHATEGVKKINFTFLTYLLYPLNLLNKI